MEALFELIELAFLLIKVLNQPSSSFLHLVQSTFKSFINASHWSINLSFVLAVPNVVSDELLDCLLPLILQKRLLTHYFELVHQSIYILNQDVISSYKNFLLLLIDLLWLLRLLNLSWWSLLAGWSLC